MDQAQSFWLQRPERFQDLLTRSRITQGRLERGEGRLDDSIRTLRDAAVARQAYLGKPDVEIASMLISLSISLSRADRAQEARQVADEACRVFDVLDAHLAGWQR